jgi:phosphopantothenoylcysteine decarboxylase/phosphopantothenate--cysteine ligase
VEPGEGYLACGWIGKGRLAEPDQIVATAEAVLAPAAATLSGQRVLVTAGPTYEDIDPVRYVGNRSSGRMGFAIAAEAKRRGATVTLVSGPTRLEPPAVDEVVKVRSAAEMYDAVMRIASGMHAVVMAAAVADYTPASPASEKIAKGDGPMTLTLERTPDILARLGEVRSRLAGRGPVLVGFAAETGNAVAKAREKLTRKHVDLIVANDVSGSDTGFDVETNAVTLVSKEGIEDVPLQSKTAVAGRILDRVERFMQARTGGAAVRA